MENIDTSNDPSKPRRPLPVPGSVPAQRPNTPVPSTSSPQSSSIHTESPRGQTTPSRPAGVGSNSTNYTSMIELPPSYQGSTSDFREPELIREEQTDDDEPPPLTNFSNDSWHSWKDAWNQPSGVSPYPTWNQDVWKGGTSSQMWDETNYGNYDLFSTKTTCAPIDGRDSEEESNWWDETERAKHNRPGPGILPPVLADNLHDPEHSLFSVVTSLPDLQPSVHSSVPESSTPGALNSSPTPSSTPPSKKPPKTPPPPPPTAQEVQYAVPHPNAYYCPKENGWVLLSWKSSSVVPPLARSFIASEDHPPLPDPSRRKITTNCIEENPLGTCSNKTHHFHKYSKAVDALKLTPAYRLNEWEITQIKQKRRAGTIITDDVDLESLKAKAAEETEPVDTKQDEEGMLMDLYMCCQCSFYCVASSTLSGVIPRELWYKFIREKYANPPPGLEPKPGLYIAIETLLLAIENFLWKGENRGMKINGRGFQKKIGWSPVIQQIFETLGFKLESYDQGDHLLKPPPADLSTPLAKQNRGKLLRAWVEISAWLVDYGRVQAPALKKFWAEERKPQKLWVKIDSARESYQTAIGAHPDQIPRGELAETVLDPMKTIENNFKKLGLTPMTYSQELLAFGYYANCRCDPKRTVEYFTAFSTIVRLMENIASCPQPLLDILASEESRQRFTEDELIKSITLLGFGPEGHLRVDYEDDIPDEFIENAYKSELKMAWSDSVDGSSRQRDLQEALRMVAEARGSHRLKEFWDKQLKGGYISPERACEILEIPKDHSTDDSMMIVVYQMRIEEQPGSVERMTEALAVLADYRNSERLKEFVKTSKDPGDVVAPTRPDWPRGLNQLGNTCYLNSLLQYFYTIKDLREAVIPLGNMDLKSIEDEKFSDDDLKKHRVGGRLVTRREIIRSKKFVSQLASLFHNLEYADTPAVTPEIELAKLALVTSKDEEDDEIDKGGTDSSNDTDATLVEDGLSRYQLTASPTSPTPSPGSVLGKRARGLNRRASDMDIDARSGSGSPVVQPSSVSSPSASSFTRGPSTSKSPEPSTSTSTPGPSTDADVIMDDPPAKKEPPPLPPRKPPVSNDSVMMFGKQHDVAECMDNCMFQIEIALLKFDDATHGSSEESDKTSVVKRLFYGKMRQHFIENVKGQSTPHVKEDLFSHLLINVSEEGFDLYDGLGRYFDDMIEYEGQKVPIEMSILQPPPLLQIQLQRVQFNRELLQSWKSNAYVKFEETLYMDRFMDTASPEKRKRSKALQEELNLCRERVALLVQNDNSFSVALENTSKFFDSKADVFNSLDIPLDPSLSNEIILEKDVIKTEIEDLRGRIMHLKAELEDLWKDDHGVVYELTSVFIHRGTSPSWGHYFFYSRNLPEKPDEWFKYNDSEVTTISKEEVFADSTGDTANPYLLVYARKGADVVNTVNRFDCSVILNEPDDDQMQS